jgi:hypothetical protein
MHYRFLEKLPSCQLYNPALLGRLISGKSYPKGFNTIFERATRRFPSFNNGQKMLHFSQKQIVAFEGLIRIKRRKAGE